MFQSSKDYHQALLIQSINQVSTIHVQMQTDYRAPYYTLCNWHLTYSTVLCNVLDIWKGMLLTWPMNYISTPLG